MGQYDIKIIMKQKLIILLKQQFRCLFLSPTPTIPPLSEMIINQRMSFYNIHCQNQTVSMKIAEKPKKPEINIFKQDHQQPASNYFKKSMLQSQEFSATLRRHSVYGGHSAQQQYQEPMTHRISSKQLKSLQKYKTASKNESEKRSVDKFKAKLIQTVSQKLPEYSYLAKQSYKYLNMIGKGGFGKVWKVQHIYTNKMYAMKQMSKAIIITKRSIESILNQRQLLASIRYKFIVNMLYAFQNQDSLFIVMNLMEGGDLRYHLSKMTVFSEGQTKFMIASIILALEHLHSKLIIHRDVKPQNIVFDRMGYAYLTDLGIAKYIRSENSQDTSGTPGYMAPQVMFHHNHRYEVDFYAVGVIIYEIIMGKRPYLGKSRQQIKQKVKEKQMIISKREIPEGWSMEAADFTNKLLQRKPIQRLGWAGIEEVKNHPWLRNFPWNDLISGKLQSPMKRHYNHSQVRYRITQNDTNYNKLLNKNKEMLKRGSMQDYFEGYTFEDYESTAENTRVY